MSTNSSSKAMVPVEKRVRLDEISPYAWEHPADRMALNALRKIPGFDSLLKKLVGTFGERNISMIYKAQAVRAGPEQYPDIHQKLIDVCQVLDSNVPPLYISQTPIVNAGAIGMDNPFIVLNSSMVEITTPAQLEVVIGHEVGHIMSEHALYRTLLNLLLAFGSSFTPVINQAVVPITLALLEWSRRAEISCDRAGLLATQDLNAANGMLCAMAGGIRGRQGELNVNAFIEQSEEYRSDSGLNAYYRMLSTLGRSHPFPVIRVAELRNWLDSGDYTKIISGEYHRQGEPRPFADDAASGVQAFSDNANKVFGNTDRYVNEALTNFVNAARRRFDGDDDGQEL